MCDITTALPMPRQQLEITKDEAQSFITEVLKEELPVVYPPSLKWINQLLQAFHSRLPFQNITFLSKIKSSCVPSWEDIQRDILIEGKGGLCLSLNVAFAAVARAFGVHAHLVPADYVATNGRSVHALTAFHLCTGTSQSACKCFEVEAKASMERTRSCRRSSRLKQRSTNETRYSHQTMKAKCKEFLHRRLLYVADVGCGFPTLRAINLSEDIDKHFVDCGLEYCFTKKHMKYLRMHRAGDEVPKGEEECVNPDGWRPVFSFTLTPQPLSYFHKTMRSIYIDQMDSPYFTELHAVRYISNFDMIAIKGTLELDSSCDECDQHCMNCKMGKSVKTLNGKVRNILNKFEKNDIILFISTHFPMIPIHEVQRAVDHFLSLD